MLPDDHFFRRLPAIIKPDQSIRLQTIIYASDLMELALARLNELGVRFDINNATAFDKLALFSEAWAIVDQVHVVRQLLTALTKDHPGPDTKGWLDNFEVATHLRNKMDHLNQNIGNLVKAGGGSSPLFGFVSFFRPIPERWADGLTKGEIRGALITVSAGPLPGEARASLMFDDINIRLPLGGLKLEAFGLVLQLENAVERLRPILIRIAEDLERQIEAQIGGMMEQTGKTREELLQPVGGGTGGVMISVDMGFEVEVRGHQTTVAEAVR